MVTRDLHVWQRKPPRPRARWVYCHKSLEPYYLLTIESDSKTCTMQ